MSYMDMGQMVWLIVLTAYQVWRVRGRAPVASPVDIGAEVRVMRVGQEKLRARLEALKAKRERKA